MLPITGPRWKTPAAILRATSLSSCKVPDGSFRLSPGDSPVPAVLEAWPDLTLPSAQSEAGASTRAGRATLGRPAPPPRLAAVPGVSQHAVGSLGAPRSQPGAVHGSTRQPEGFQEFLAAVPPPRGSERGARLTSSSRWTVGMPI